MQWPHPSCWAGWQAFNTSESSATAIADSSSSSSSLSSPPSPSSSSSLSSSSSSSSPSPLSSSSSLSSSSWTVTSSGRCRVLASRYDRVCRTLEDGRFHSKIVYLLYIRKTNKKKKKMVFADHGPLKKKFVFKLVGHLRDVT